MNQRALTLGLSGSLLIALCVGCGDDETSNTTTGPGASSSSASGSGGMNTTGPGGSGSGGSSSGSGGAGGQSACAAYCSDNLAACSGANAQWVGADPQGFCEASCAIYPLGNDGEMTGDTLACRVSHSDGAVSDPAGECAAAGPYGGNVCGTTQCQVFCRQIQTLCTGPNEQYANEAACLTACALLPDATQPYAGDAAAIGNNLACRGYHLTAAAVDPATHCPHAGGQQQPCM